MCRPTAEEDFPVSLAVVTGTLKAEDKRGTKLQIVGGQTPSSLVKTHRTCFHLYPAAQLSAWGSVLAAFPSPPCAGVRGFCTGLGTNQRMARVRAAPNLENRVSKSVMGGHECKKSWYWGVTVLF